MIARRRLPIAGAVFLVVACGRVDTRVGVDIPSVYIEAEDGQLSGGFVVASDPQASGGKYILPPAGAASTQAPGAAAAEYMFHVPGAGVYVLWGRIRAPGVDSNTFWVTVDGGPSYVWRLSTGVVWFWGMVTSGTDYGHPIQFALDAGDHRIVFRNSVPGVALDRLYVTVPGDVPPGNDTPCNPPHSIQLVDGACQRSCGSFGNTTCGLTACAGQTFLPAYDCTVCCKLPDGGVLVDAAAE